MPRKLAHEKAIPSENPIPEEVAKAVIAPEPPAAPAKRRAVPAVRAKKTTSPALVAPTTDGTATSLLLRRQKPRTRSASKSYAPAGNPPTKTTRDAAPSALLAEIRTVRRMVEQLLSPRREADADLDGATHSLRRLLSELIEERLESVVRDLVAVRRDLSAATDPAQIFARLDELLEQLGAVRFEAEPMDVVDPLIHVVIEERQRADAPAGVVLETLRPGYRTARGLVLCKAAVAINRQA